jgi:hypothetical protein
MPENLSEQLLKDVSKLLSELIKIIKVVAVYPENNPLPAKLKESFSDRFTDLIKETGGLVLTIAQNKLIWQNRVVFEDRPPDEALAQLFHNAGITEISFSSEFGFEEAGLFFSTMKTFVNREAGGFDLVALFWQTCIPGFDYCTVDDLILQEYDGGMMVRENEDENDSFMSGIAGSDDSGRIVYSRIFLADDEPARAQSSPQTGDSGFVPAIKASFQTVDRLADQRMGLNAIPSGSDTTQANIALILNDAFAMNELDREKVEEILHRDSEFEPYGSSLNLLREIVAQEEDPTEFSETLSTLEKMQSEFLRTGEIIAAGEILSFLRELDHPATGPRRLWPEKAKNALAMAGSKERLDILGVALNSNAGITAEDIEAYLNHFGWEALSAITGLLSELEHRHHREAICHYLTLAGREHIDIIARGIYDRRWFVVRNTVAILAAIGGEKAFGYLEKAIGHDEPRVRQELIKGLVGVKDRLAIGVLVRLVWDSDVAISREALAVICQLNDEPLLDAITTIINDDRFTTLSGSDQEKLLITFSSLGGEQAAAYLDTLISGWKIVKNDASDFYQRTAFRALGYNKSEKAEKILLKHSRSWSRRIKKMANEALSYRRRIIYGEK